MKDWKIKKIVIDTKINLRELKEKLNTDGLTKNRRTNKKSK